MLRGTVKYIINVLIQKGLGVVLYLIGAGWIMSFRASAYFIYNITATFICLIIMVFVNPETLKERNKKNTDSPIWDKILLSLFWLLAYFVIYLIAGIESKRMTGVISFSFWLGIVLNIIASGISLWALIVNNYLESTARIQKERGQTVCQTGPYKIIRHPTYLGLIIWCITVSLVFPTCGVIFCSAIIAIIIIIRTYLEDKMLQNHLSGYKMYAAKVKYRLIPFIW
jgi:protein-S-isoprenylcysteine O-methyltransferase Ste14